MTGVTRKIRQVMDAKDHPPPHTDVDHLNRSQAKGSNTIMRRSHPGLAHGMIWIATAAAGTGPQSLTKTALIGTDMTAADMMTTSMAVIAGALTRNLCTLSQKGVSAMTKILLLRNEAQGAGTGNQRLGQRMTNMMPPEVAG